MARIDIGIEGGFGAFHPGSKIAGDAAEADSLVELLGTEQMDDAGNTYRLVRLDVAAGLAGSGAGAGVAPYRAFGYDETFDAANPFDVQLALLGGAPKRVCGFGVPTQVALNDNDFFWIQVDGPYIDGFLGDDGGDVALNEYVQIDDDADRGKLKTSDTVFDAEYSIGASLEVETGTDAVLRFRPIQKLQG